MQYLGDLEVSPLPPLPAASGNNERMFYVFNKNDLGTMSICCTYSTGTVFASFTGDGIATSKAQRPAGLQARVRSSLLPQILEGQNGSN